MGRGPSLTPFHLLLLCAASFAPALALADEHGTCDLASGVPDAEALDTASGSLELGRLFSDGLNGGCEALAKARGLAVADREGIVPDLAGFTGNALTATQLPFCRMPQGALQGALEGVTYPFACTGHALSSAFTEGFLGDLAFLRDSAVFAASVAVPLVTQMSVDAFAFSTDRYGTGVIRRGLGYETSWERAAGAVARLAPVYARVRDYLGTDEGREQLSFAFCYSSVPAFRSAADLKMLEKAAAILYPAASSAITNTSCRDLMLTACDLAGIIGWEIAFDALWEAGSAALAASGAATAVGVAAATVPVIRIVVKAVRYGVRAGEAALGTAASLLRYISRFVPEDLLRTVLDGVRLQIGDDLYRRLTSALDAAPAPGAGTAPVRAAATPPAFRMPELLDLWLACEGNVACEEGVRALDAASVPGGPVASRRLSIPQPPQAIPQRLLDNFVPVQVRARLRVRDTLMGAADRVPMPAGHRAKLPSDPKMRAAIEELWRNFQDPEYLGREIDGLVEDVAEDMYNSRSPAELSALAGGRLERSAVLRELLLRMQQGGVDTVSVIPTGCCTVDEFREHLRAGAFLDTAFAGDFHGVDVHMLQVSIANRTLRKHLGDGYTRKFMDFMAEDPQSFWWSQLFDSNKDTFRSPEAFGQSGLTETLGLR